MISMIFKTTFRDQNVPLNTVTADLRGMRRNPISKKDTLMLRKNSNTNTINQTLT